jgi:hypothetical protein
MSTLLPSQLGLFAPAGCYVRIQFGFLAGCWSATNDVACPAWMLASGSGASLRGRVRRGVVVRGGELGADLAGVGAAWRVSQTPPAGSRDRSGYVH